MKREINRYILHWRWIAIDNYEIAHNMNDDDVIMLMVMIMLMLMMMTLFAMAKPKTMLTYSRLVTLSIRYNRYKLNRFLFLS